jgi:hypothetical protein
LSTILGLSFSCCTEVVERGSVLLRAGGIRLESFGQWRTRKVLSLCIRRDFHREVDKATSGGSTAEETTRWLGVRTISVFWQRW